MTEKVSKYLIIEGDKPLVKFISEEGRQVLYAGEGSFTDWKNRLNNNLDRGVYFLTQITAGKNKGRRELEISTAYTLCTWQYQFPSYSSNTVKLRLNKETKGLLKKMLEK